MMQRIIDDIHHYVEFLERIGYKISLSLDRALFTQHFYQLLKYDIHDHAICDYLKLNPSTAGRCVLHKQKLLRQNLIHPYYACCYAGVEEFLIPVREDDLLLGCIFVSGYRGRLKSALRLMKRVSVLCDERFPAVYGELSENVPTMEKVLSFTKPLAYMLVELYRRAQAERAEKPSAQNSIYPRALQIIYENVGDPITGEKLAERMNYSVSYLRYIFQKEGNVPLQAKINQIRIEKAERLLRGTTMSVTDIAFSVGFADSNYFSYAFKKQVGLSPLAYRRSFKERNKD